MKKKALKKIDFIMYSERYVKSVVVDSLKANHGDGLRYEL